MFIHTCYIYIYIYIYICIYIYIYICGPCMVVHNTFLLGVSPRLGKHIQLVDAADEQQAHTVTQRS